MSDREFSRIVLSLVCWTVSGVFFLGPSVRLEHALSWALIWCSFFLLGRAGRW